MKSRIGHGDELPSIPCTNFSPSPVSLLGCSREDAEKALGVQTRLSAPQLPSSPDQSPCPPSLQPVVQRETGVGGKGQSPKCASAFGKGAVGTGVWVLLLPISQPFWPGTC